MITGIRRSQLSQWIIAAVALPLASMPLAAGSPGMEITFCSADGTAHKLTIPVDRDDGRDHCAKPCHACLSHKKNIRNG